MEGTKGATRGLEASKASVSDAVRPRKEERYVIREGRSSRDSADTCCIMATISKKCLRLQF